MRNVGSTRRALVAMFVGTLILPACGGDDDEATPAPATTGAAGGSTAAPTTAAEGASTTAPATTNADDAGGDVCTADRVGGELTMGTLSEPPGLDPVVNRGTGSNGNMVPLAVFDTLVRYDTENDEFVPVVAKSLEPNADFTEWTLKLREGVTFGNGDPLTADIVKTSFARHQDPANRSPIYLESLAVTGMDVIDPLTLVFHLNEPWARFPALLAHVAGMVTDQAVIDAQGDAFNTSAVGGGVGPYEVERWAPGEELVLKAKENWWGGPVCIQRLRFIQIPGGDATYDAFKNGEIQIAYLRDASVVAKAHDDGVEGYSAIQNSGLIFALNNTDGPTADPVVRQAVAAAIDPEVINDRVYGGAALPTTALIDEQSVHYDGLEGPKPDAAKAAELVAQAKAGGWDGNLNLLCQDSLESQNVCITAKAMMDAAGMNVSIETVPVNDLIPRVLTNRNFEMARFGLSISDDEPWLRLSTSFASDGALNASGYSNPEMDAALDALRSAPDEAARKQALADIQRIWNETLPSVVYASVEDFLAIDDSVKGVELLQNAQLQFDKAYIEQ